MSQEEVIELVCRFDDMIKRDGGYKKLFEMTAEVDRSIKELEAINNN